MTLSTSESAERERRARYAESRDINGILDTMRATESELIAADLRNAKDKVARHDAAAMRLQLAHP